MPDLAHGATARRPTDSGADLAELPRAAGVDDLRHPLFAHTERLTRVGGWELDLASKRLRWSDEVYRIHGLDRAVEPTLEAALGAYPADAREVVCRALDQAQTGGPEHDLEVPFVTAGGRRLWVRVIVKAQRRGGRPTRLFGTLQDITERKQAELALQERERRLLTAQRVARLGYWRWSIDGVRFEWSPGMRDLWGVDVADVHVWREHALPLVHPEDRARVDAVRQTVVEQRRRIEHEYRIRRADGGERWLWSIVEPEFDAGGKLSAVVGTCRDITRQVRAKEALARSEQRYRALVEGSVQGILVREGFTPLFANEAYARILGFDSAAELLALPSLAVLASPEAHALAVEVWAELRDNGGQRQRKRIPVTTRDGRAIWLDVVFTAIDWEGRPAVLHTAVDVTAQKLAEDELQRTMRALHARNEELAARNAELARFTYIASHDLRAPLVNIQGFTKELHHALGALGEALAGGTVSDAARNAFDEDVREALGFIESSVGRMDRLINGILNIARIGQRRLDLETLDVATILAEVVRAENYRLRAAGASIEVLDLPPVYADRLALEQVFSNLIDNALKYRHPERPLAIVVAGRRRGERVLIDVDDNGRGFEPAERERVFELFQRVGRADQPGEGMGLACARALLRRQGGDISCDPVPDEGTVFTVALPFRPPDATEARP